MPVARIQRITERWVHTIQLELDGAFDFAAGQYLEIEHSSGVCIPLSIASAPHRLPELELHYRSTPGDVLAGLLDELLEVGNELDIKGPFGDVIVTAPEPSLMLVAGGTGIAQALSIIEHIDTTPRPPLVTLLWCADTAEALYARDSLDALPWLDANYTVDHRTTPDNDGLVWLSEHLTASAYARVLLCGGPSFVYAICDHLHAAQHHVALESDVFAYAPRDG